MRTVHRVCIPPLYRICRCSSYSHIDPPIFVCRWVNVQGISCTLEIFSYEGHLDCTLHSNPYSMYLGCSRSILRSLYTEGGNRVNEYLRVEFWECL